MKVGENHNDLMQSTKTRAYKTPIFVLSIKFALNLMCLKKQERKSKNKTKKDKKKVILQKVR